MSQRRILQYKIHKLMFSVFQILHVSALMTLLDIKKFETQNQNYKKDKVFFLSCKIVNLQIGGIFL